MAPRVWFAQVPNKMSAHHFHCSSVGFIESSAILQLDSSPALPCGVDAACFQAVRFCSREPLNASLEACGTFGFSINSSSFSRYSSQAATPVTALVEESSAGFTSVGLAAVRSASAGLASLVGSVPVQPIRLKTRDKAKVKISVFIFLLFFTYVGQQPHSPAPFIDWEDDPLLAVIVTLYFVHSHPSSRGGHTRVTV